MARTNLGFEILEVRQLLSATPTTISLSASSSTVAYGTPITLTATVETVPANSPTIFVGTVTFLDDGVTLGTAAVQANTATLSNVVLPNGAVNDLTASYSGSAGSGIAGSASSVGATSLIQTVAGGGFISSGPGGILPTMAALMYPESVAVDSAGNIYIADSANDVVREVIRATGTITTIAGDNLDGYSGDGGPATATELDNPVAVAVDSSGNVFIAESGDSRIREVNHATGIITTVAGTGVDGYSNDGIPATLAALGNPRGLAVDSAGDLFISDTGTNRIREVNASTGIITTVAGVSSPLNNPIGLALDSHGDLFIADTNNYRIRELNLATGLLTTFAGNGTAGESGDGGPATAAEFTGPLGVAVDSAGDVFITDAGSGPVGAQSRVREVNAGTGNISTLAGGTSYGYAGDNGPVSAAGFNDPVDVAVDSTGNLYIVDEYNQRIREVYASTLVTIAQSPVSLTVSDAGGTYNGLGFPATANANGEPALEGVTPSLTYYSGTAATGIPSSNAPSLAGNYTVVASFAGSTDYVAAQSSPVTFSIGVATTISLSASSQDVADGTPITLTATVATVPAGGLLTGMTVEFMDGTTTLGSAMVTGSNTATLPGIVLNPGIDALTASLVASLAPNAVAGSTTQLNPNSTIIAYAGDDGLGYSGDGGLATAASLFQPQGVIVDSAGDVFIADTQDRVVREVNHLTGVITTIAGSKTPDLITNPVGDGGPATAAELEAPVGLAFDCQGDLFIADAGANRIREVNHTTGIITTVAGIGSAYFAGDGGQATAAYLNAPAAVAVDSAGDLFIADTGNARVREVNAVTGIITTIAGSGQSSYYGNGILATAADLAGPSDVALNSSGDLFIADPQNNRVREVNLSTGVITTVAGNGGAGYAGDGGPATATPLDYPSGVAVDSAGDLLIADSDNNRIREVNAASGIISTVAGMGFGLMGNGGPVSAAGMYDPVSLAFDSAGDMYIADTDNNQIREVVAGAQVDVSPAGTIPTAISLAASTQTVPYDIPVTLTATVSDSPASAISGGAVTFTEGTTTLGTAPLTGGVAVLTNVVLPIAGINELSASYSGYAASNYDASATVVNPNAIITTFAGGNLPPQLSENGVPATAAGLEYPQGVVLDSAGNVYISDTDAGVVLEVNHITGMVSTVAGAALPVLFGDGGPATAAYLQLPTSLAVDAGGDIFIDDSGHNVIREVNHLTGIITTVAGGGSAFGNGVAATAASLNDATGIATDSAGDLFIADSGDNVVQEVSAATGEIRVIAGIGNWGYNGDGIQATAADLASPADVALDGHGDLFIVDAGNNRVREVNLATGIITSVAGPGNPQSLGDGGPATAASLASAYAIAVDSAGDLFIAQQQSPNRIREVNAVSGIITTVAGGEGFGGLGDNGAASAATFYNADGVAVDSAGDLFIADMGDGRIREVVAGAQVTMAPATVAVTVTDAGGVYTGAPYSATATVEGSPSLEGVTPTLTYYSGTAASGTATPLAPSLAGTYTVVASFAGSADFPAGQSAPLTFIVSPTPVALSGVAASASSIPLGQPVLLSATVTTAVGTVNEGTITFTVAGNAVGSAPVYGGFAQVSVTDLPAGEDEILATYSDSSNSFATASAILSASSILITAAGTGTLAGNGVPATAAELSHPESVALDSAGDLFIADTANNVVREVNHLTGTMSVVAGNGISGFSGNNVPATASDLSDPAAVAVDSAGDLFIETDNLVEEVNSATGLMTTIAGGGSVGLGDGLAATLAGLWNPQGLALDSAGDLFIADAGDNRIREVNATTHVITTVAGNGSNQFSGDGSAATAAGLDSPSAVALDSSGDLYIADTNDNRIREVNAVTGMITTVAGSTGLGFWGDGGPATLADLYGPQGIAFDSAGNLFISDNYNNRVREVNAVTGIITTLAGTQQITGNISGGPGSATSLSQPVGLVFDGAGNLLIADSGYNRVAELGKGAIVSVLTPAAISAVDTGGTYTGTGTTYPATVAVNGASSLEGVAPTLQYFSGTRAAGQALSGAPENAGTYTALALFAGSQDYSSAIASTTFTIARATPTVSVVAGSNTFNGSPFNATPNVAGIGSQSAPASALEFVFPALYYYSGSAATGALLPGLPEVAGTYTALASFSGSADYTSAEGSQTFVIYPAQTTISLSASKSSIAYTQQVLLTATVSSVESPTTGVVTFTNGGTVLGTVSVYYGTAQLAVSTLPAGSDQITATYADPGGSFAASVPAIWTGSIITTVAGIGNDSGDGGAATLATLGNPDGIVVDSAGDFFIAEPASNVVREVNHVTGVITTVAGTGIPGYNGDNIAATAAELDQPEGLALDSAGDLFIADESNQRVREVNLATGIITTVVGTGVSGFSGNNAPATASQLSGPAAIAFDSSGDLFIADSLADRVVEASAASGLLFTVAGNGTFNFGSDGDGGPATAAELNHPQGLAMDAAGDVFIADTGDDVIREVNAASGVITTIAGTLRTSSGDSGNGGPATAAFFSSPISIALDAAGNLYVADSLDNEVREINHATGIINSLAGSSDTGFGGFNGDGGAATAAQLNDPQGVALDSAGDLFIADSGNYRVREISHASLEITTVAGTSYVNESGDGGPASAGLLSSPQAITTDTAGDLFIADNRDDVIREVNHVTGIITTVAGNGIAGFSGDGGQATAAQLEYPDGLAVNTAGDLFIADAGNDRIREVNLTTGVITTVAGTGSLFYNGDNIPATAAALEPAGLALDSAGDLLIADEGNSRIRKINYQTQLITTVAGNGNYAFAGDGGLATAAGIAAPVALAIDSAGDLFIADSANQRIREVNAATGVITTVAGNGQYGFAGDGGPATAAEFEYPEGIAVNASGNLFISDSVNNRVREVNIVTGVITTVAGGPQNPLGNGGPASAANLIDPVGLAFTAAGDLLIADSADNMIRQLSTGNTGPASTTVTVAAAAPSLYVVDSGGVYSGSPFPASDAIAGIGSQSAPAASLEGVTPALTYYSGSAATGAVLSAAPSQPGTYTVVASFAGSTDYVSAAASTTFFIGAQAATVNVTDSGGTYTGTGTTFPATATVNGSTSLEGVTPTLTYYSGTAATGSTLRGAPSTAGTYTALASFTGNADYAPAAGSTFFTISKATPTVAAADAGGTYNGFAFYGTGTVAGVGSQSMPAGSLESVAPRLSYYSGTSLTGSPQSMPPSAAGTYTVIGSFAGSADYTSAQSAPATFSIAAASAVSLQASTPAPNPDQPFTLTANVEILPVDGQPLSGGVVTFYDGTTSLGTAPVSSGTAVLTNVVLPTVGGYLLTASYSGSTANNVTGSVTVLSTSSAITTAIGDGNFPGSGGPASSTALDDPAAVAFDSVGDLFIADAAHEMVREVNHVTGMITTIAGTGANWYSGDGGPATAADLSDPCGIAVDSAGDVFISDNGNYRIREINHATGIITTVAGNGTQGSSGQGGPATLAELSNPHGLALDSAGDLFIAGGGFDEVCEVNQASGVLTVVAGNGYGSFSGDGGPATAAELLGPYAVALDSSGDLFIADWENNRIREVNHATGIITTVAGTGIPGYTGNGGQATAADLDGPLSVAVDSSGDIFLVDAANDVVREVNHASGLITTVAGNGTGGFGGDGGAATAAELEPAGLTLDSSADIFIADGGNNRIREVNGATGIITTVVGNGSTTESGDGGPASSAELNDPNGSTFDASGNLLIADVGNERIREVNAATGLITTIAGNGVPGYRGDGGPATAAELNDPSDVVVDSAGDLFIADSGNRRVREVNHITGIITTVAGNGVSGFSGDGGQATAAEFGGIAGIALDSAGDLFIADSANGRVREVNLTTGIITTVAGNGAIAEAGDGGPATAAELGYTTSVIVDSSGDLLIAADDGQVGSGRVREVNLSTGIITTVAGDTYGDLATGIPATLAQFSEISGLALDSLGDLFIADSGTYRVCEVNYATGLITMIAGNGLQGYSGDNSLAGAAELTPGGIAVDSSGDVYISDLSGNRIREVSSGALQVSVELTAPTVSTGDGGGTYTGTGTRFPATATVDGGASLEGVTPTLSYYSGTAATGSALAGAPSNAGTYLALASFAGSTDYSSAVSGVTFTIAQATPVVSVGDAGGAYNGSPFAATDSVAGVGAQSASAASLEDVTPTLTYYTGTAATGAALNGAPSNAGTYLALASFAGSADYMTAATSATFTINQLPATVSVSDPGGVYNSVGFPATATVNGSASLEGVTPSVSYYSGTALTGTALGVEPSSVGTYTALASFTGSTDYTSGTASTTFTINKATSTVTVTDVGGPYTGSPYAATDTVNGGASLESVTPTVTYYSGTAATGTALSGAPTAVGTYTVVGSFAGSTDYTSSAASTTFTITGMVAPTVSLSDAGGAYNGSPYVATATVNGGSSLDGVTPTVAYYSGTVASGTALGSVPSHAGTYTVIASYAGSTGYFPAQSSPVTFVISPVPLTITANNQTKVYGAALPTLTLGYSGFVGSDSSASLAALPTVSTTATSASPASGNPYTITASGAVDPDYSISYVAGSLTITAVPTTLSLTTSSSTIAYGQPVTLTATITASPTPNEGNVTFTNGGSILASQLVSGGAAQLVLSNLPLGVNQITATYTDSSGDYSTSTTTVNGSSTVITAAGVGLYAGDGGPATEAVLQYPVGVAVDSVGDIFFADSLNNVVREVNHASGVITTVAGNGTSGYNGDNIPATACEFNDPEGVAVDAAGDLFIVDQNNDRIREVNHATGIITTVAGTGSFGFIGDGGPATAAQLYKPDAISLDSAGNLYIADTVNLRIREVNHVTGVITTIAGDGNAGDTGDTGPATGAELEYVMALAVDSSGDVFVADSGNNQVLEVVASTGMIHVVAGTGFSGKTGDGGQATLALLNEPQGVAVDSAGDLFIADSYNGRVREVNAASGIITTISGAGTQGFGGDNGPASAASLNGPLGLALDSTGDLFLADSGNNRIREINAASQVITTVAGASYATWSGDGGPATAALVTTPEQLAMDSAGDLFIADFVDNVIREVNHTTGVITTVAGNGVFGFSGDGGPATAAELKKPEGIAVDSAGDLFIADSGNNRIREVNHVTGIITTVVGSGTAGFKGDGGLATAAELSDPSDLAIDSAGNLYILDWVNDRIREVNAATQIITTVAGNGVVAFSGDAGQATAAELDAPAGIAVDTAGDLFIAETTDNRVREVNHSSGIISTVAGNGAAEFRGNGGQATAASLDAPFDVAFDSAGDWFIADGNEGMVREVNAVTGVITTAVGSGYGVESGNGGPASVATLESVGSLVFNSSGDLFIASSAIVREVLNALPVSVQQATPNISVNDAGGAYTTSAYPASASVNGSANLEGVTPTISYYSGTAAAGTALSDGPSTAGTYTVVASFTGSTDYTSESASAIFTIAQAQPTLNDSDTGGTYTSSAFAASETISGVGSLSAAAASLESVTPTLTYYSGTAASGTALSGVPSSAGTYTVLASFTGSTDYTSESASAIFTIAQAPPTLNVSDAGGTYTGSAFSASDTISGVGSQSAAAASLESVTPGLTYYSGPAASGTALSGVPSSAGTYTVAASFTGSTDYTSESASAIFTIAQAQPTLNVSDTGGTYTSSAFAASETISGVGSQSAAAASLESVTPGLTYYSGSAASGTALSGAPSSAGTYTVLASFAGSTDYTSATSNTTFTIDQAAPTIVVIDNSGTYSTEPFPAQVSAIEGVTPTLFYYSGTTASGAALSGAPSGAGSYTVVASFAGSTDDTSGTASTTFMIAKATPILGDEQGGQFYPQVVIIGDDNLLVAGVGSQSTPATSLEGVTPTLAYYSGTSVSGSALPGLPSTVGTYLAVGSFAGSTDYTTAAISQGFTISASAPTLTVADPSGPFDDAAFAALAIINGSPSLEGVTPTLTYYSGTAATGTASSSVPSAAGTYTVLASFAGSTDYTSTAASTLFSITPASPTVSVSASSGTYTGAPLAAAASVAGVGSQSIAAGSLEGVSPLLTYYSGTAASGSALLGAPSSAGTYTVLASFAGSSDYTAATGSTTFTITPAAPTVGVSDNSSTYTGAPFTATTSSIEAVTPTLLYYSGTAASGTASASAPSTAGTYTVLASFAGSTDYTTGDASTTFTIHQASPNIQVVADGGTYTTAAYRASGAAIEGVSPAFIYYSGTAASGAASTSAPSTAGTYTVLASFAGSTDYTSGTASTTFTITKARPTVGVSASSGTYTAAAFNAAGTVAGVGSQSAAAASLEGNSPTFVYYSGTATTGGVLAAAPSHAGTYTVVASFAGSADYAAGNSSPTTFVISPAPLTITADDQSMAWGDSLPTLTASYSGFVGNDSAASLTVQPVLSTTATSTSAIYPGSPYPITVSGAVDSDYTISYVAGQLTITSAVPPSSSVAPLDDRTSDTSVLVSWSGTPGTGGAIQSYTIEVTSTPLGNLPSQLPQSYTTSTSQPPLETSYTFVLTAGYTYSFTSQATDAAGVPEPAHTTADTTLTIQALPWQNPAQPLAVLGGNSVVPADALAIIDYLNLHPGDSSLPTTAPGNADYYDVLGQGSVVPADALAVIDYLNLHPATQDVTPAAAAPAAALPGELSPAVVAAAASLADPAPTAAAVGPSAAMAAVSLGPAQQDATGDPGASAVSPAVMAVASLPAGNGPAPLAAVSDSGSDAAQTRRAATDGHTPSATPQAATDAAFADPAEEWRLEFPRAG